MRNVILCFVLLISYSNISAQSDAIINTVTLCITDGRYNDGEKYLDSLLKVDAKNIDAIMMKGNLLLNYALMQTPALNRITVDDESVYSQEQEGLKTPVVIIPKEPARKIEKLWKQCIDMDSERLDIRQGLCTLYGMADMRQELIDYLPVMAEKGKVKGSNFVNTLVQYGELLSERGDLEGEYELYRKIAALYPHNNTIWCVLAQAYHTEGDLANAKLYAAKAIKGPIDTVGCEDALDIYPLLGEYSKYLSILKTLQKDRRPKYYPFAAAIYKYATHDARWKKEMYDYLKQFPSPPDSNIVYNIASYMLRSEFKDDYSAFIYLLSQPIGDHFYSGLLLEKAMYDYKDSLLAYQIAAQINVSSHNYSRANAIFEAMEKVKKSEKEKVLNQLQYAFSLYCAGEYNKSYSKWSTLKQNPENAELMVMTNYFLGVCNLKLGKSDEAVSYFRELSESNNDSKYAFLAKLRLDKMSQK